MEGGFQSTPPVRGATGSASRWQVNADISIHAPRAGGDLKAITPTLNARISIHAPRAGGDEFPMAVTKMRFISIHAPRAGGDSLLTAYSSFRTYFNPRPPCGGRLRRKETAEGGEQFQSTPPVRGATHFPSTSDRHPAISIHAPRAGGDRRGRLRLQQPPVISIHAPRAGGDECPRYGGISGGNFNPRPPCGGRRTRRAVLGSTPAKFQSTPPVRGGDRRFYISPKV